MPWWRWVFTGLNTLALALSIILSWHQLAGGTMAGCGGGSPCDQVLNSRWSTLAGILPVSGLAVGAYLALLVAGFYIGPKTEFSVRRFAWKIVLVIAGAVAGSAIWFTIIQKWIIGDFCIYCMSAHITGLILASLVIWQGIRESRSLNEGASAGSEIAIKDQVSIRQFSVAGPFLTGLILAGILAAGQALITPSSVDGGVSSYETEAVTDYTGVPMIGSSDATYIVTLLFDYQCPHCQKIHFMLDEATRRYSGKLAFVICPVPLNSACNPFVPKDADAFKYSCELAKTGLAVWLASHEAFPAFETWMFTFETGDSWRPRSLGEARDKAIELVGQADFDLAWSNPWIDKYLKKCISIFGQTIQGNQGGVPKLIFGDRWVMPQPDNTDNLVKILKNSLAIPLQ